MTRRRWLRIYLRWGWILPFAVMFGPLLLLWACGFEWARP